ncbi:SURF1 family protein [Marinihelvus fidelis]|nr:SURF1 family protein [Marinihelvus fidelis]
MRFRPSLLSTLVLFSLAAGFLALGQWQAGRAVEKDQIIAAFESGEQSLALPAQPDDMGFSRVSLAGSFDTGRAWLVDNQVFEGRPGVHVLAPMNVTDERGAARVILVNRGWLSQGRDRMQLPDVPPPPATATVRGHLAPLKTPGLKLGEPEQALDASAPWPRRVLWPDMERFSAELGQPLYPLVLYLDASSPAGLDGRDWQPVAMGPDRHRGYAIQWYALAATAIGGWLVLAFRRRT